MYDFKEESYSGLIIIPVLMRGHSLRFVVGYLFHIDNCDLWVLFMQCWCFYFVLCAWGRSIFRKPSEIDVGCVYDIRYNW